MDYRTYVSLEFERTLVKLFRAEIKIKDNQTGQYIGYVLSKAFKPYPDIRIYRDMSMVQEICRINGRNIISFSGTFDVFANNSDSPRFSVRRHGFRSALTNDHWDVLDASGSVIASATESCDTTSLLRRWCALLPVVGRLIDYSFELKPQLYTFNGADGRSIARVTHHKYTNYVELTYDTTGADMKPADHLTGPVLCTLLSIYDARK